MEFSLGEPAGPPGRDADDLLDAHLIDTQEGVEYGGDQQRASRVALQLLGVGIGIGGIRLPGAVLAVLPDRVAKAPVPADCLPELLGQLPEEILTPQVAARLGDLVPEHL